MSDITLSILGILNQYPTLFNGLHLPEDVNKETLTTLICAESAELEVLYTRPEILATVIDKWSTARLPAWERMLDALTEEYNPLHNYDRRETETVDDTEDRTTANTRTQTGEGERGGTDITTGQLTGFNSNNFADDRKTTGTTSVSETSEQTIEDSGSEGIERGRERTLRAYGNIGVTTSMAMLREELRGRQTDIYNIIADEFIDRFCLLVY